MNIGKSIQICLIRRGWSRADLAAKLGVTRQSVDNFCKTGGCSAKRLAQLAQAFDMSVSDFIAVGEDNET